MKIFGNENGRFVLYVQVKDLRLLGQSQMVLDKDDFEFVEVIDRDLYNELYIDRTIVSYNSSMRDGMGYLYNKILELKDLDDPILSNYREDLEYIFYYRMGKGYIYPEIRVPALTNYVYGYSCVEDGIRYNVTSCVDLYRVVITREDGEKNFNVPNKLLEEVASRIARIYDFDCDDFMYCIVDKVDDGKSLIYKISFISYEWQLEQMHRKMQKELEKAHNKRLQNQNNHKLVSGLLKKFNIFKK